MDPVVPRSFSFKSFSPQSFCQAFLLRYRQWLIAAFSCLLTTLGFFAAFALRFDFELAERIDAGTFFLPLAFLLLCRAIAYDHYDLHRGYWRYVSTDDAWNLFKAHLASSGVFMVSMWALSVSGFPRSVPIIEFALSLLLAVGSRLVVRMLCEYYFNKRRQELLTEQASFVIFGGSLTARLLLKSLKSQHQHMLYPMAIFDDNPELWGQKVSGVPVVGGIDHMRDFIVKNPVEWVTVTCHNLPSPKREVLSRLARECKVPVRYLRSMDDVLSSSLASQKDRMSVEQLLNCDVSIERNVDVEHALVGKRVLITGAGGSIGSELVRQVLSYGPRELILVDKCEFNLYSIEQEIRHQSLAPSSTKTHFVLADISQAWRMTRVFNKHMPEVIFHAAAYKHVPLLEKNVCDGFINNVVGTRVLLEHAKKVGAERFILISTDKAVDPSSIMGCTKRIAELMVSDFGKNTNLRTAAVRFGNVINSAGSVIPLFVKQIQSGVPITVTDERMERYFMSIRQAVRLVLNAASLADSGEIYLLDMGSPVRILDVAKKLRSLYGREDLEIVISGLRPGEKLSETLHSHRETKTPTGYEKISRLTAHQIPDIDIFELVSAIEEQVGRFDNDQLGRLLMNLVNNETEMSALSEFMLRRRIRDEDISVANS